MSPGLLQCNETLKLNCFSERDTSCWSDFLCAENHDEDTFFAFWKHSCHSSTLYPTSGSGMFFCRDRGTLSAVSSHLFQVLVSASLVAPTRPSLPQRKLSRPPVGIKCSGLGIFLLRLGLVEHG